MDFEILSGHEKLGRKAYFRNYSIIFLNYFRDALFLTCKVMILLRKENA